jgi:uncharacterized protein YcbK (DUF882 family)
MRSVVLSLAALLAFAGTVAAQTKPADTNRGTTASSKKTPVGAKAPAPTKATNTNVQRAAAQQRPAAQAPAAQQKRTVTPQQLRASRYGGFAPQQELPPPDLDLASPRSLSLVNYNTKEEITVTYWSNGAYHRDALNQLNHFLRDSRDSAETEMDPLLFDVLWHTTRIVGFGGSIEVLSAYRSPTSNAWLASVSRGVARDSQHMNGNAMDIRFPGVPVFQIRQAARSLNMGGVGFYPRSGFVHLDTGPVRYW